MKDLVEAKAIHARALARFDERYAEVAALHRANDVSPAEIARHIDELDASLDLVLELGRRIQKAEQAEARLDTILREHHQHSVATGAEAN